MGKHVHVLESFDKDAMEGVCRACGPVILHKEPGNKRGVQCGRRPVGSAPYGPTFSGEVHRLVEKDPATMRGVCVVCGPVHLRYKANGQGDKFLRCATRLNARRKPYTKHKGEVCERCDFVPEHPRQLDVHHRDHDRKNNAPANLETLCANCHRLEHVPVEERTA
jgi:5-methylcytosine-specific restriction endonuclease McrA